jgi:hypothetical protein
MGLHSAIWPIGSTAAKPDLKRTQIRLARAAASEWRHLPHNARPTSVEGATYRRIEAQRALQPAYARRPKK